VHSKQGETILVILHLLHGDIPALDGMALLAIRSHLPLVNIGVAIRTVLPNVGECRLDVAQNTVHLLVHAPQRILGLVVIELKNLTDTLPTRGGMTILTGKGNRAVRVSSLPVLRLSAASGDWMRG
jgi:hypothetical protein